MQSENELVEKAQRGDAASFEKLVRRYARLLWATVSGMVRDRSWTEDLVQETFMRAWKAIGQLENPEAFRPWVLSIARRLVFRHTELHGRSYEEAGVRDLSHDDLNHLDAETTGEYVQSAIQHLPERYRLPVTLRYLNNMDYQQISTELGLTNGALRGLLNRGVAMLRKELKPFWSKNR